ncbi:hypothetical protein SynBIOSU31_01130 [Synechococcus sp. BIOS-U3-1]|nr:hypothetical protein SynBIOSU31_01130 [Synechococcus sp. BIOS-U3-1]
MTLVNPATAVCFESVAGSLDCTVQKKAKVVGCWLWVLGIS